MKFSIPDRICEPEDRQQRLNPILVQDLEKRLGVKSLIVWIEEEAERLSALGRSPGTQATTITKEIMLARNVIRIVEEETVGKASIVATDGRYIIFIKAGLPDHAYRFAIAHELGHTYWFAPGGEARPLSPLQWRLGRDASIELLCNRFAAALLLSKHKLCDFISKTEPAEIDAPFHLAIISDASKEFRVAERLVARRIFYEVFTASIAVISLRRAIPEKKLFSKRESTSIWRTSWCTLPAKLEDAGKVSGFSIPFRTSSRIIPDEMIPVGPTGVTREINLDGRWWQAVAPLPQKKASIPLEKWPLESSNRGYVLIEEDRIYLALPLDSDHIPHASFR